MQLVSQMMAVEDLNLKARIAMNRLYDYREELSHSVDDSQDEKINYNSSKQLSSSG
jgi:hypothetical protein